MNNAMTATLKALPMDQVAEIAARCCVDMRDEAGDVLAAALDVLETKMDEADFIRFCNKLAA